jgi:serine/threonine protein kinase
LNVEPERLRSIEEIFHAALEVEPQQVDSFLRAQCAGDEPLRRQVEALLDAHRGAGGFIDAPIVTFDDDLFQEEEADRLIGQTIGQYEILERIGRGGMGAVYLARRADRQYEKRVAIKLIKRGMDTDAVLRHFRNERQILASFDHPNIARLLDGATTADGLPYFIMEYVEGLPIDEYCSRQALPVTERLQLFRQVCAAVSYAHRRAVIHRDLKPSNILVSADGVPKLLDFGIARILQPGGGSEAAATMIGLRVMTPEYASPEQVRGEPVTTASDVYSLGVVLYRLLTGRLPYRLPARSSQEMARAIGETEPQKPSTAIGTTLRSASVEVAAERERAPPEGDPAKLRRRLRGDLDNIVLMALRKEPERRYATVEQFSEDIRRHLESRPVLARRDTLAYRAAKFVRRNTAATAAAALVVVSLLGGIVATAWQAHRARTQEAIAQAEKTRAERRFNEVRQLARSVLFDYHDAIKDLPGATAVRERLVRDGLAYLDSLAGEAGDDPELQRELAAAYERLGDVRGQAFSASLGDLEGAQESYLTSLRIRESLVAAHPRDVQNRRDLASSYIKVGTQLTPTEEAARGVELLRKASALYLQLATEQPASPEIRHDLAAAYNYLGLALEDRGDAAGALENHRKALPIREALAAQDSGNQAYQRGLVVTHINLGRAQVLSGDTRAGLATNQKALAMCAALHEASPISAGYRLLLANAYQNDGDYRALLGDTTGALGSFRRKLVLDEQALEADSANIRATADIAYTSARIGALLAVARDYAPALAHYRRALAMFEKAAAISAQNLHLRLSAIVTRAGLGETQAKLGQRAAALEEASKAMSQLNAIPEDPASTYVSSARGSVYGHVAATHAALAALNDLDAVERQEHWRTARGIYVQGLRIWQDMQERGILTGEDASKPQEVIREIARCDESLRRFSIAASDGAG